MVTLNKSTLTLAAALAISACNPDNKTPNPQETDTTPPSLVSVPVEGTVLLANESVTVSFSEAIAIDSFKLSQDGDAITNFTTEWNANETEVVISPSPRWAGGDSSITLEVADKAGNTLISEPITIRVNLTLEMDQQVSTVFGELVDADRAYYGNAFMDENGIWLADYSAEALYFFEELPEERDAEPDHVITAIDFINSETLEPEQRVLDGPQTPFVYKNRLFVADYDDGAVYIFDSIPTSDQLNFGIVLGYPDFTLSSEEDTCSASRMNNPEAVMAVDGRLLVADGDNNRVLIWNTIPTASGTLPDLVLGQSSFDSCDDGVSEFAMNYPSGVWSDGTKLLVTDGSNNRVLGWNSFPTSNNQPADFVLGQADFTSNECNLGSDAPNAESLCNNYEGIFSNGRQIFVADSDNNRVLVWNDWPTENGVAADLVLGQPDFTSTTDAEDLEEPADNRFNYVAGVFVHDNLLLVSDEGRGSIVVFDGQ